MPQFDKITFLNQIIWLFFFFSGTYILFLKFFLPKIAFILKLREKKLFKGFTLIEFCPIEIKNLQKISNLFWGKLISELKDIQFLFKNLFISWILKQNLFINLLFIEKKIYLFKYFQLLINSIHKFLAFKTKFNFKFNFFNKVSLINFLNKNTFDNTNIKLQKNNKKKK